jgi:hypothetical protein
VIIGVKAGSGYRHRMTDVGSFRRACHAAARRTGGAVIDFRLANGVTPNFHQGLIAYPDRTVAVACMRDAAVLAIAVPRAIDIADGARESGPLTFVDAPDLVTALAEVPGFCVLTPTELNGPFDTAAWPDLPPGDIKRWRPGSLGEALFNYWD